MKNLKSLFLLALFFLVACTGTPPDPEQAADFIEEYINKTGNGDFSDIGKYYSEEMKWGEDDATRERKMQDIHNALGNVKSIELIETTSSTVAGQEPTVTLKYKVIHELMTVKETYTVKKEGEEYKILKQSVENFRE